LTSDGFILSTSSEGLQALGSAAQRSHELVAGTVRTHLGDDAAALFAEPVPTDRGAQIEWYTPRPGQAVPLEQLSKDEADALETSLAKQTAAIQGLADQLAARKGPEDFWLAEALRNALVVPSGSLWALRGDDGSLSPLLVNWARQREERRAVRGVLAGLTPAVPAKAQPALAADVSAETGNTTASPLQQPTGPGTPVQPGVPNWRTALVWLLGLGWLTLAGMIAVILWLLIAPCGLKPTAFASCGKNAVVPLDDERNALLAQVGSLTRGLESASLGCILDRSVPAVVRPVAPEQIVPPPEVRPAELPPPETPPADVRPAEGGIGTEEIERRLGNKALTPGADLTFSLAWDGLDDLDLHLVCPEGDQVNFRVTQSERCRAILDVDANFPPHTAVNDPVENISVTDPVTGTYRLAVHRMADYDPKGAQSFELFIRQEGEEVRSISGVIEPSGGFWTYDLEISAK
jgi:hypothetical protein